MKTPTATPLYYIGLMSGTSLDGIDAALIAIEGDSPPHLLATHAEPMPDELHRLLFKLCHAEQVSFAQLAAAEHAFCQCQTQAVKQLLAPLSVELEQISAIGSHGQTIEHSTTGVMGRSRVHCTSQWHRAPRTMPVVLYGTSITPHGRGK